MVTIYLKWGNKLVCGHDILFFPCMSCASCKSPHSKKWSKAAFVPGTVYVNAATVKHRQSKQKSTCCPVALLSLCTALSLALGGLCRCWRRSRVSSWDRSSFCTSLQRADLCCAHGSEMSDVCPSCSCLCCCRPAVTPLTAQHLQEQQHSVLHRGAEMWLQQQQIFSSYCDVDPRETLSVVD